jgi:N-carbamoyl-L-amino-acid hydrolase
VLGLRWYDCVVKGMEAHAGPTPMALRKDALQVATCIMQETVSIAHRYPPYGRGTVGFVQVFPNSRNVIPGEVKFSIDLRNVDTERLDAMDREIRAFIEAQAKKSGLEITLKEVSYFPPCPFDAECVNAVEQATQRLGYSHMNAVSGAGHDAVYMARVAPAGMVFIPCKDGISHNEIEDARPEHIEAGCNVLLAAMLERARVVETSRA